ncbi:hypothetical protein FACS189473_0130 [Spirochaetia bacterium]|nr:hypothetical protein FACS189473_0130 [Spirochaetia bacterium]
MFITDPYLNRRWRKDKKSILDVRLTLPSGKIIQIEVQIRDLKNMAQRVLYDQAKMIADQMESREDYRKIRPVISVLILDHIMLPEEPDYLNTYEFRNIESHRPSRQTHERNFLGKTSKTHCFSIRLWQLTPTCAIKISVFFKDSPTEGTKKAFMRLS